MSYIKGQGVPFSGTSAAIGDIYKDELTGAEYKCVDSYRIGSDGEFISEWKEVKKTSTYKKTVENIKEEIKKEESVTNPVTEDKPQSRKDNKNYSSYYKKNK